MTKPTIKLQDLQARIGHWAKSTPAHRFWGLHVHIKKQETLNAAYLETKRNKGAPGSDGLTFKQIEMTGRNVFVTEIAAALHLGVYRPQAYRKQEIPKGNGKTRTNFGRARKALASSLSRVGRMVTRIANRACATPGALTKASQAQSILVDVVIGTGGVR